MFGLSHCLSHRHVVIAHRVFSLWASQSYERTPLVMATRKNKSDVWKNVYEAVSNECKVQRVQKRGTHCQQQHDWNAHSHVQCSSRCNDNRYAAAEAECIWHRASACLNAGMNRHPNFYRISRFEKINIKITNSNTHNRLTISHSE